MRQLAHPLTRAQKHARADVYVAGKGDTGALGLGRSQLRAYRFTRVTLGGVAETRIVRHARAPTLTRPPAKRSIAAGDGSSAAISSGGELFEWGFVHASRQGAGPSNALPGLVNENREAPMSDKLKALLRASTITYLTAGSGVEAAGGQLDQEAIDREAGILQMSTRRDMAFVPRMTRLSLPVVKVALGYGHTLVLLGDGSLQAKGYNDRGQLGSGTRINSFMFEPVQGLPEGSVVDIACGNSHNLACTNDGRCVAWGSNVLGQLGIGSHLSDQLSPHAVVVGQPVVRVCAGSYHSLVLAASGDAFSFGHSEYGQHGSVREDGGGDFRNLSRHFFVPQRVGVAAKLVDVQCGDHISVGIDSDNGVWTWGWGAFGVLGRGERNLATSAMLVPGLVGVRPVAVAAGKAHVLLSVAPLGSRFALTYAPLLLKPGPRTIALCTLDGKPAASLDVDVAMARCPALRARCDAGGVVTLAGEARVLQALAQYLFTDVVSKCPPHRLVDLAALAEELRLPRLAALCDLQRCQRKRRDGLRLERREETLGFDSVPPSSFADDLHVLLHSGSGDVRLRAGDGGDVPLGHTAYSWNEQGGPPPGHTAFSWHNGVVTVHSQVMARFEYFSVLLGGRFAEAERVRHGEVVELGVPYRDVLVALVEYIYTGRLTADLPAGRLLELFSAARLLGVDALCQHIEGVLADAVDADNADAMADLADRLDLPRLAAEARRCVASGPSV